MSTREPNSPTLASLRAARGKLSSARPQKTSSPAPEEQAGFLFIDEEITIPESPAEPVEPEPVVPRPKPPERRIWTVADLVGSVRQQIEAAYADLWVEGEISNCRPAPSGHIYFTLKDKDAQLPVVLFRRQAQLLRFRPEDGLAVLVRGRVSIYESRGQLQLIAETMEPRGAGSLQLAFEQLKARLLAEGLFDASRKRLLPPFPHCIGVITSPTGAVIRDIVTVVRRRHARLNLLVFPAVMQGAASPGSVAAGIRWFNRNPSLVDLIVIARGGGSMEDLAGFNNEALARIIAASEIPIVSAIGHETDFTIADFVADLRAPTPSAAAELITAAQHRIEERVDALSSRIRRAIRLHLLESRQRYARLSAPTVLRRVSDSIDRRSQRVDELALRLDRASVRRLRLRADRLRLLDERLRRQDIGLRLAASHRRIERSAARLDRAVLEAISSRRGRLYAARARLQALSPLNVLARGYALVYVDKVDQGAEGVSGKESLLRSASEVVPGQKIRARLASGTLSAQVTATDPTENGSS
ncbi:MAG TPA: exodeoxyribonuclease VII large subunit [Edaphobacter sp.]|jgi:exodeoxyribonuclease VII large subunit|nr:exodeoxyribonuclease VII large subunit [Edaphobacter sp.]